MQKVMKEKIGADYEPYLILGICNPQFANRALSADRSMGLLLPCTAVLRQTGAEVEVSILDPEAAFSVVELQTQKALEGFPQEVKKRLQAALSGMEKGVTG